LPIETADAVFEGKIVFSSEGGYNPVALAKCLTETAKTLTTSR